MHARRTRTFLMVTLSMVALTAAACGGGTTEAPSAASAAVQGKVTVTPDTAAATFALAKGTYRVNWKTTDCKNVVVQLVGDNGFNKEKKSTLPNFSWVVTSVPDGTYTAAQTDPGCTAWELAIEKIGGS